MLHIPHLLQDALHLFYPNCCQGCGSDLIFNNQLLCIRCLQSLPHTRFAWFPDNPIEKIFSGRLNIAAAHSEFYFSKGQLIQELIHQLKYNNNKDIGIYLGEITGESLLQSGRFSGMDAIIPLPMYPDKEYKRGYNQAAIIAEGIAKSMNVPLMNKMVLRSRLTETQTKKHRADRWQNVEGSFNISNPSALMGKKVLLVDDVITTGATIEACAQVISQLSGSAIYIATLAHASK
jgi:ComF family protein